MRIIGYRAELSSFLFAIWSRGEVALNVAAHLPCNVFTDVDLFLVALEVAMNLDPQSMQQPDSNFENFSQGFKSVASSAGPLIGSSY